MGQKKSLLYEELEPRLLFSAGLEGVLLGDSPLDSDTAIVETVTDSEAEILLSSSNQTSSTSNPTREVVFISEDVDNFDRLIEDLAGQDHIDVYILDDGQDGINQITSVLGNYQGLEAVHLVSHGSNAGLQLGNGSLDVDTLTDYQSAISSWQAALNEQADLLLYGCDLASGTAGQALVNGLQNLTGADVAASDDRTGHAALGGDWELEYQRGEIETAAVFSSQVQSNWNGVLAAPVVTAPANQSLPENSNLVFSSANGNAFSISDVDSSSLTVIVARNGTGTMTLNGTAGLTFNAGDGTDDYSMNFSGSVADINAALDGMYFTSGTAGTTTMIVYATDGTPDYRSITVTINGTNQAPTIGGTPDTSVTADNAYSFTPATTDIDTDVFTYSITNKPAWATFDTSTGELSGTPGVGDVGTTAGIIISVNDGVNTVALSAFDLSVTNDPPTISGTPDTSVTTDQAYSFTPTTTDADSSVFTYSIANKPAWASFDTGTGELSGTPGAGDVGTTAGIIISVNDGVNTVALSAFDLAVTDPPAVATPASSSAGETAASSDPDLTLFEAEQDLTIDTLTSEAELLNSSGDIPDNTSDDITAVEDNIIETRGNAIADADFVLTVDDELKVKLVNQIEDRGLMPDLNLALSGDTVTESSGHRHVNNITEDDGQTPDLAPSQWLNQNSFQFGLKAALEELNRNLGLDGHAEQVGNNIMVTTSTGISIALTAGFINWALKGQSLAAAFLSAIPSWNAINPVPVIGATNGLHTAMQHTPSQQQKHLGSIFKW